MLAALALAATLAATPATDSAHTSLVLAATIATVSPTVLVNDAWVPYHPPFHVFVNLTVQEFNGYAAGVGIGLRPRPRGPIFNLNLLHGNTEGVEQSLRVCGFRNCPTCRRFDTSVGDRGTTGVQFVVQIPVR